MHVSNSVIFFANFIFFFSDDLILVNAFHPSISLFESCNKTVLKIEADVRGL